MKGNDMNQVSVLVGLTLGTIEIGNDEIVFVSTDNRRFKMHHQQDCCESVRVEEVIGDIGDLINVPILVAEERTNQGDSESGDSQTWTFYEFATIKGSVTIRWLGESNGYYSESVDFEEI